MAASTTTATGTIPLTGSSQGNIVRKDKYGNPICTAGPGVPESGTYNDSTHMYVTEISAALAETDFDALESGRTNIITADALTQVLGAIGADEGAAFKFEIGSEDVKTFTITAVPVFVGLGSTVADSHNTCTLTDAQVGDNITLVSYVAFANGAQLGWYAFPGGKGKWTFSA